MGEQSKIHLNNVKPYPLAPNAHPSVELTMKTENRLFEVVPGLTGPDHIPVEK